MQNLKMLSFLFFPVYIFSFFFVLSSSHLFIIWLGMELNLISFLGVLKLMARDSLELNSMKYFLSQALGSLVLVLGIFMNLIIPGGEISCLMLIISIMLKLGLFPLHEWFISFSMACQAFEFWLVSIPQKVIPVWLLMNLMLNKSLILGSAILGVFISLMAGLGSTRMLFILAYSSLMNTSWLVVLATNMDLFFLVYFTYSVSLLLIVLAIKNFSVFSNASVVSSQSWLNQVLLVALFLNLSGLPPFLNMWGKGMLMFSFLEASQLIYLVLFLLSSVCYLFIYLRTCFCLLSFSSKMISITPSHGTSSSFSWLLIISFLMFLI